jgi:hypothetical protein
MFTLSLDVFPALMAIFPPVFFFSFLLSSYFSVSIHPPHVFMAECISLDMRGGGEVREGIFSYI